MKIRPAALALATVGVLLAGCSAAPATPSTTSPAAKSSSTPAAVPADEFLTRNNLTGLTTEQIITQLDASEDDRQAGPFGSVRPNELQLSDSTGKISLPLTADKFYLSIAPYVNQTHDCFNHNLASCKGEMANQTIHVTITDATGATMLDQDVTTFANGFAGLWLPRDAKGTLTVNAQGKTVTTQISTGPNDPTCLTTLKLL